MLQIFYRKVSLIPSKLVPFYLLGCVLLDKVLGIRVNQIPYPLPYVFSGFQSPFE